VRRRFSNFDPLPIKGQLWKERRPGGSERARILIWYALVHAQLGERMDRPYRYPEHTAPAARAVQSVGTRVGGAVGRRVGRSVGRRRTGREVERRIEREVGRCAGRSHGLADDAAERRLRVPRRW
jgi:hypothetical protein